MPQLTWVGKDKVKNHHHDVPFRLLNTQYTFTANEGTPANSTGNKIIHGDNLEALKSLLPEYEGKVNCIYIDPPYNTGNEGWVYNDNVNDPKIKKWLGQVVGKEGEDLSRHDKWLCMMYPRLKLLHRLLADDGVIFISIDDNEQAHLKLVMDEVFGAGNFVGQIVWKNVTDNNPTRIAIEHEYVVCYAKKKNALEKAWKSSVLAVKELLLKKEQELIDSYSNKDDRQRAYTEWFSENKSQLSPLDRYKFIDDGGIYIGSQSVHNPGKEGYRYDVMHPKTKKPCKQPLMGYRFPEDTMQGLLEKDKIIFGSDHTKLIELKVYVKDYRSKLSSFFELDGRVGTNQVKSIFSESNRPFDYPKPVDFVEELISFATMPESIILDSFAGSGTTAHAVLNQNAQDGGNRKFLLIEMMDYTETITAERVRRVMNGYGKGNKAVAGLGGSFDYVTVGEPLFLDDGNLNELVGETAIRQYVAYSERVTLDTSDTMQAVNAHCLGLKDDALFVFYYEANAITALSMDFLATLAVKNLSNRPNSYVIYADKCTLTPEIMQKYGISFKRIPRDITRF